jgi:hypothetical protein
VIVRRAVCVLVAIATLGFARAAAAQNADVIRGRVVTVDSVPIPNATVTATTISGNVNRSAKTDRNGRYTITFPNGDGDYIVKFVALGYSPRQYELKRAADEDILVANAALSTAANTLDAVHVTAARDKANRNDVTPDIGGTEKAINAATLTADQLGDLAAMAASVAGVNYVAGANGDPSGFSVLGLTPDQNSTTLNGMNSNASNLPRDAQLTASLVTSPYDVSQGGFSGGRQNIRLRSGTNINGGKPWGGGARAGGHERGVARDRQRVHEPVAERPDFRSDLHRQGVLQCGVPARAEGEPAEHAAQHRLARLRDRRSRGRLGGATARHPAVEADPALRGCGAGAAAFRQRELDRRGRLRAARVEDGAGVQPARARTVEQSLAVLPGGHLRTARA